MSSKKYASPLHLKIASSGSLLVLFLTLHIAALLLLFVMPLSFLVLILSVMLVLMSGFYSIGCHALKLFPASIVGLIWDVNDEWFLLNKRGEQLVVDFDGNSFVHPWCSVLNFKLHKKILSTSVVLLSDNVDENIYRRLRVRLKVTSFKIDAKE